MYYIPDRGGKINDLVKKLQIADSEGTWYRNTITLNKIRSSNLYRDEIILSLEEEKEHLLNYIDKYIKEKSNEFKTPQTVMLGGWFVELLYKPSFIHTHSARLKIKDHLFSSDYGENHECELNEDYHYEQDNCLVDIR